MDDLSLIVEAVCRLPIDYREFRIHSMRELIRRSGFEREQARVTAERIHACLAGHPDWVDAWIRFSQDTRGTPAWYFEPRRDGRWVVGLRDRAGRGDISTFGDRVSACAEYILETVSLTVDRPRRPLPD